MVGEVPPGVDPTLMEASLLTGYSMVGSMLPYVRGQWVQLHQEDPETLKQRFAKQLGIKQQ